MRVVVRLFAGLRERAGTGERHLDLANGATARDVWPPLGLGDEPEGLLYAVNRQYADPDTELVEGAEGARIPPGSRGAVGFTHPANFCKYFHQHTGQTPAALRAALR